MRDIRIAFRQLRKSPGFTAVALLTLALGIGACVAIFSVVSSVLLRPLPYPDSERLVDVIETKLPEFPEFGVAPGQYFAWRAQSTSFENLAAIRSDSYNLTGAGEPARVTAFRVTANTFATFGVRPALGRDFSEEEDEPGKENVVILSHAFWQRQFGGRSEIVGQLIHFDGRAFGVIGVMPKNFLVLDSPSDVFTPAAYTGADRQNHGAHYITTFGRLKANVTLEQSRAEMKVIADRLSQQYPDTNQGFGVKITPLLEAEVGDARPMLLLLLGAVGFLLLIATANVANLLLSRATGRSKEIAIRAALGASQGRIVRQLLTESIVLALLGGFLGWLLAQWGTRALIAFAPEDLPRVTEIFVDARAFGFAFALSLVTGIAFGIVPAVQANRIDLTEALKEGGRGTSEGGRRKKLRGALVVAEIAVTLVLLAGAGLLIRSFVRLQNVSPGFEPADAFAVEISLSKEKYGTPIQQAEFVAQAKSRLGALPGVLAVGASQAVPFVGGGSVRRFKIEGRPVTSDSPPSAFYAVTADYFQSMKIPVLSGRALQRSDVGTSLMVVVINESMAKKLFADTDPIGRRISIGTKAEVWREIVGVVGDVKHFKLDETPPLQTYAPFDQASDDYVVFVLRTASAIAGLPPAIRSAIHAVDSNQPIASIRPLREWIAKSMARQRFSMLLFTVFSGVAIVLAAIGIYGVMAYSVAQRQGEIGVRIALGAPAAHVLRLVLVQAGRLVVLGVGLGLLCGAALARLLASMFFDLTTYDPLTLIAVVVLLTLVAAAASLVPSLRAAKVDPMIAMRTD
ncbi:MAG TPA: ABC transporter permease [Polyangiaceae bacterium]|nr:ABC transporter permease [Polyangiaceae bacterium]